ncbi:MAG: undecaprenyldiphospho-muramoylpentapeptide beta-N-acetylglucosaminyltransferase [Deinococcota bacterium]|nr:undecaprenyldiphospho-muramoylpentapeptide beta-N-acetylglucosaminyltransferase [Deinococcota bacterium]
MTRVLFATGGSGGHIYPALAVATELQARGVEVAFIGQEGGMETSIVPQAGFSFYGVRAGKWDRFKPDPRQAWQALLGLLDAKRTVQRLEPGLVVGFGGFASFPGLVAALRLGVPIVMHEQNAFPGRVTRWLSSRAHLIATAQPEVSQRLPKAKGTVQVGLPVREVRVGKEEARRRLGLPQDGKLVFVMGGSQGSVFLNRELPKAYRALGGHGSTLTVLHSSGRRWQEELQNEVAGLDGYRVQGFVEAPLAWAAADLAITRAGATTLAEAAFYGVPLLMVPLPSAADDHQSYNARAVEAAGAGIVVPESQIETLAPTWRALLDDRVLVTASQAALGRSPQGAAAHMAKLLTDVLATPSTQQAASLKMETREPS